MIIHVYTNDAPYLQYYCEKVVLGHNVNKKVFRYLLQLKMQHSCQHTKHIVNWGYWNKGSLYIGWLILTKCFSQYQGKGEETTYIPCTIYSHPQLEEAFTWLMILLRMTWSKRSTVTIRNLSEQQISIWTCCNLFVRTPFLKKFIRTYEAAEEFFMSAECLLTGAEQLH